MEVQDGTLGLTDLLEVLEAIIIVLDVGHARQHVLLAVVHLAGVHGLLVSILTPGLASQSDAAVVIVAGVVFAEALIANTDIKAEPTSACLSDPHEDWTLIHL